MTASQRALSSYLIRIPRTAARCRTKSCIIGTYDIHSYAKEVREALEAWERRLSRIIGGKPADDDNVTPIRREQLA